MDIGQPRNGSIKEPRAAISELLFDGVEVGEKLLFESGLGGKDLVNIQFEKAGAVPEELGIAESGGGIGYEGTDEREDGALGKRKVGISEAEE